MSFCYSGHFCLPRCMHRLVPSSQCRRELPASGKSKRVQDRERESERASGRERKRERERETEARHENSEFQLKRASQRGEQEGNEKREKHSNEDCHVCSQAAVARRCGTKPSGAGPEQSSQAKLINESFLCNTCFHEKGLCLGFI